jgi:hypothetical protein
LPAGWQVVLDHKTHKYYYWNKPAAITQWEQPRPPAVALPTPLTRVTRAHAHPQEVKQEEAAVRAQFGGQHGTDMQMAAARTHEQADPAAAVAGAAMPLITKLGIIGAVGAAVDGLQGGAGAANVTGAHMHGDGDALGQARPLGTGGTGGVKDGYEVGVQLQERCADGQGGITGSSLDHVADVRASAAAAAAALRAQEPQARIEPSPFVDRCDDVFARRVREYKGEMGVSAGPFWRVCAQWYASMRACENMC